MTLARPLSLPCLLAALAGCAAGPGLVSVPLVGSIPTGGVAPMTQASLMSGMSVAEIAEQCQTMAQVAADPGQPPAMRQQVAQSMGMLGCPS